MRKLLGLMLALAALSMVAVDADARKMSGGRSIGKQREAINPNQAAPRTPAQQQQQQQPAPAQQQAAPAQQTAKGAPPAQQPSGMSRWLGPLAGLAIGAGLASLFFNNGLGGALLGLLMIAALVAGAVLLFRLFRGSRSAAQPLRYAGAGASPYERREPVASIPPAYSGSASGAAMHSVAATTQSAEPTPARGELPAGFDAEQFVRHAKTNFTNLQAAYDRRDLTTMRDFLTPEVYREIEADIRASGNAPQDTEIVTLDAEVLDVATESGSYVVSVRFSGVVREEPGAQPQPFSEVWHLEKPLSGRSGWLVSGIQQLQQA